MFGFKTIKTNPQTIFSQLRDFEAYCLGKKFLSPENFRLINEELSLGSVLNIGKHRFVSRTDGTHLIWTDPMNEVHDLGPVDELRVMREYPGFHRYRSLALGHSHVLECKVIDAPNNQAVTMIKMNDGTVAFGTNYKTALRNAALKMHLKSAFMKANPATSWQKVYGNA